MRRLTIAIGVLAWSCSGSGIDKTNDPVVIVNNGGGDDMGVLPSDGGSGGGDSGGVVDLGGPITEPDGPMILDFSAAPDRLTEGGTVNIIVNLSDPQGFDDIGGGRVLDRNDAVVGAFTGSGGAYSFALTWNGIHTLDPISFGTDDQRIFTAEFFDAANHRARQSFAITLHCDGDPACDGRCGLSECDGECRDIASFDDDPDNCGMCGRQCPTGICIDAECADCEPIQQSVGPCDPLCQTGCAAGEACVFGGDPNSPQSGCAPAGNRTPGEACAMDDLCVVGAICAATDPNQPMETFCYQICRPDGGAPACPADQPCARVNANADLGVCLRR